MKTEKKFDEETLGGRLKGYEADFESTVPYDQYIVVRIDGHKFSKFTKGFTKPYDSVLSKSMEETTKDLVAKFGAVTGYTQSDEISLIFKPSFKDKDGGITNNQIFGGRVQKIASLVAAYTTMRFNEHLKNIALEELDNIIEKKDSFYSHDKVVFILSEKAGNAWFDARVFGVSDESEAYNAVMWRVRDAEKNSRSMFAQTYCSHKSLLNKTGPEQVAYCKAETGKDWEQVEDRYKYGIFVKKEAFLKPTDKGSMDYGQQDFVRRTRVTSWAEPMTTYDTVKVDLVVRKLRNEEDEVQA
jgi:tRNA(His) guanylyltransferase